ncbi:hypothetical protein SAMN05216338_1001105 [Bradyrhizobium sp. Rc2d]|uniref:hypothetical protein n=1 Tax=Bradyrhizobium sp. Rc2d TaxID=1855321 RepID=UPI0008803A9C|nr:hypothetical protein [Bradyrhizobium sp. Rc2d]SDG38355.1 hypothetical protein SAMN05216338_1001105 [Bradyrhizobium sp. Rc2d]
MAALFHVYTLARTSDIPILQRDLCRSPYIANGCVELTVLWNQPSAAAAYARAIETATADFLIFAHCDVYFPENWFERLAWEVDRLTRLDPNWAVAATAGITSAGEMVGRIFDTALVPCFPETSGIFGRPLNMPVRIESFDELAFVVRRETGVSFDPLLPEFHLYATDLALEAERKGKTCYGLDMPVIHNAKAQLSLGPDYVRSYRYMVKKWRDRLPVATTCGPVTRNPFSLPIRRLRTRYKALFKPSSYSTERLSNPAAKAKELGLDRVLAAPLVEAAGVLEGQ